MSELQTVYLAGGCFWGVEALMAKIPGVVDAVSGYMGGHVKNVTYKEVCSGLTGHAEVVKVSFDPEQVGLTEILHTFWEIHDPTTPNRQGPDVGSQYRSAVFVVNDAQRAIAEQSKQWAQAYFPKPIVTDIALASDFWPAEDFHQDYFAKHPGHPGCHVRRPFARNEAES